MSEPAYWIVKLVRRRDGKKYYYRHDGCTTARMESSMRLDKETATQLAKAITKWHKDFSAKAVRQKGMRVFHPHTANSNFQRISIRKNRQNAKNTPKNTIEKLGIKNAFRLIKSMVKRIFGMVAKEGIEPICFKKHPLIC